MSKVTTGERLKAIMEARDLKQRDILKLAEPYCNRLGVKLGKSALSQYISGDVVPGQEKIAILSYALNVSEAWLMGFDVPMERATPIPDILKDERLNRMVTLFNCMTTEEQDELISMIEWKLSRR